MSCANRDDFVRNKKEFLLLLALPAMLAAACTSSDEPRQSGAAGATATGSAGATAGTGAAGSAAGTTGSAGTVGAAGTGGPDGGAAGTGSATAGTSGGSPDASTGNDGGGFPSATCAPGAIFCDGFEEYPILKSPYDPMGNSYDLIKTGETMPTWLSYHFHGPPRVDASKAFKGKQNFHIDTESGHIASADVIKVGPDGADLWPAAHYGRVMVWLKAVPPSSPWGIMTEQGLLPGSTTDVGQFTLGGVGGKVAFTYTQRKRVVKNDVSSPKIRRGGDAQNNDAAPLLQCRVAATSPAAAFPAGKWACVEWMIDRTKPELHLWIDGQAATEVDVVGKAGACSVGAPAAWTGPERFTELDVGWEVYGNDGGPAWEAWFDEVAVGTQRLGCPSP
jgi:hypothetical protein